tara:strand:+ start:18958 stop:19299 length:342 start_codon:yes stop_codon:yes gene_type:complete
MSDNKVVEFPSASGWSNNTDKDQSPSKNMYNERVDKITPDNQVDKSNNWVCKCCGVEVDDKSDRKVLPISMGGDPNNPQYSLTFYICPGCYSVQMPEEIFEEMHRRMNSSIIQ